MNRICIIKWITLCLCLLFFSSKAQQGSERITLTGFVCDSLTGERLEFISLYEKGTTNGTITNTEGEFSLLMRSNGILTVSCIGYHEQDIAVGKSSKNIQIRLVPDEHQLSEVIVRPKREHYHRKGNPSVDLARKVIKHKNDNPLNSHDYYSCERYENTTYSLNNFDGLIYRKWKKRYSDIDQYTDTANSGSIILPVSSSESVESVYYQKVPERMRSHCLAQRHVGLDEMMPSDLIAKAQSECFPETDLDKNDIYMFSNKFVNPLSDFAILFYKFYILDTLLLDDGYRYIDLAFAPQQAEQFGFIGHLYISADSSFFLKKADFSIPPDINLNFVRNMHMSMEQDRLEDGTRVITRKKFECEMTAVGQTTGIYAQREICYSQFSFGPPTPDVRLLLNGLSPRREADDMLYKKEEFWVGHQNGESISRYNQVMQMIAAMRERPFLKYAETVLTCLFKGYIPISKKPFEENKFLYGPLNTSVSYNSFEGMRLRTGGLTTATLSPHWFGYGYVAYGCNDQEWKYDAKLEYSFKACKVHCNEFPINKIMLEYCYDTNLIGQDPTTSKDNFLLSVKRNDNQCISYERKMNLSYLHEYYSGFSWKLSTSWIREYSTSWAPFITREQSDNCSWRRISSYDLTSATILLRYAPHETFIQNRLNRTPINFQHPVYTLQHSYGHKGWLGSDFEYQRTDFSFEKRFWLSAFGYIDSKLQAGIVWSQSPYTKLCIPNSNLGYIIQEHSFSQMNTMEFISDRYYQWDIVYYLNGWFFNSIPLLRRLQWREIVSFRGYFGDLSDKNNPMALTTDGLYSNPELFRFPSSESIVKTHMDEPYMEATVGIENIFKFLRVDYIRRLNYNDHPHISKNGIQAAVHLTF